MPSLRSRAGLQRGPLRERREGFVQFESEFESVTAVRYSQPCNFRDVLRVVTLDPGEQRSPSAIQMPTLTHQERIDLFPPNFTNPDA